MYSYKCILATRLLCVLVHVQAAGFEQCPLVWDDKAARQAIKVAIR